MQDIINSFKAHLYDRTSNPLVGSFIFYWLVCNYKLVVVLLDGDLKSSEKFELIKTLYPQEVFTLWTGFDIFYYSLLGNGLLIPLVITLIYIFLVPIPAKYIYEYWKEKQKEIQEIKQKIEDETPLTKEQSKKIRQDMINLEIEYENSFKRKDEEIYQLKEVLKSKELNTTLVNKTDNLNDKKLVNEEQAILQTIGELNLYLEEIKDKMPFSCQNTVFQHYIDELLENKFITTFYDENSEMFYKITKKGRKYLVENGLI